MGQRAAELRRARGLTQEALAEKLGMLAPNYARIEQGRQNVTLDTLVRVAKALAVPLADLFRSPKMAKPAPGRPSAVKPAPHR